MKGGFEISVIQVDDFESPSKDLEAQKYNLDEGELTYLYVPSGCITAIKATSQDSKLLVLADYRLGEINDEYRYSLDYFKR